MIIWVWNVWILSKCPLQSLCKKNVGSLTEVDRNRFFVVRKFGLRYTSLVGTRYGAVPLLSHRLTLRGRPAAASPRVLRAQWRAEDMPWLRVEGRGAAAEMDVTLPEHLQELAGVADGGDGGGGVDEVKANPAPSFFWVGGTDILIWIHSRSMLRLQRSHFSFKLTLTHMIWLDSRAKYAEWPHCVVSWLW